MTERPILFSGSMVRAILDGSKTQTRRIVAGIDPSYRLRSSTVIEMTKGRSGVWFMDAPLEESTDHVLALNRYGIPGDRLWVRETHAVMCRVADPVCECEDHANHFVEYRADTDNIHPGEFPKGDPDAPPWKPSIFMPRWASRILLEVTDIRVERLQAITDEDAEAEGIHPDCRCTEGCDVCALSYVEHYAALWDSINADRAPWASNPWVWVVSFRRVAS